MCALLALGVIFIFLGSFALRNALPRCGAEKSYDTLAVPTSNKMAFAAPTPPPQRTVDALIFTKDRPLRLLALLESHRTQCRNAGTIAVVVSASTPLLRAAYVRAGQFFPYARFYFEGDSGVGGCRDATLRALQGLANPYIMPLVDEIVFTRGVDLAHVAASLDEHSPNGTFQLRLGAGYVDAEWVQQQALLENAVFMEHDTVRGYPWLPSIEAVHVGFYHVINLDASVYSAAQVRKDWAGFAFRHPGELEYAWYGAKFAFPAGCLHLYYARAVCVNIESGQHVREDVQQQTAIVQLEADAHAVLQGKRYNIAMLSGMDITTTHMAVPLEVLPGDIGGM